MRNCTDECIKIRPKAADYKRAIQLQTPRDLRKKNLCCTSRERQRRSIPAYCPRASVVRIRIQIDERTQSVSHKEAKRRVASLNRLVCCGLLGEQSALVDFKQKRLIVAGAGNDVAVVNGLLNGKTLIVKRSALCDFPE